MTPTPQEQIISDERAVLRKALTHCLQVLDMAAGEGLHYSGGGEIFDAGDAVFELAKALGIDIANVGDVPGLLVSALLPTPPAQAEASTLPGEVVQKAKAAVLANLRDRRLLKWLFKEDADTNNGPIGYVDGPIDEATQDEIAESLVRSVLSALPAPEPVAEDKAQALIAEAARLVAPADGEAVFYIRVGGERTHMTVKTSGDVDPDTALQNAISTLNGERRDLSNCPMHTPPTTPAVESESADRGVEGGARVLHGANSHLFDEMIIVGEGELDSGAECIAFANEPWASRIAAALRPALRASEQGSDYMQPLADLVQSYGDQREAAARADERERVADLVDAADNLLKRMEASNTAPLALLRRRLAAFRREALGEG